MAARIGVVGAGVMGRGIARAFASAGHPVRLADVDHATAARAVTALGADLDRAVAAGRLSSEERDAIVGRVASVAGPENAASGAELVVEAIIEDLAAKRELFGRLDRVTAPEIILATNTSALSIDAIAAATHRPGRVLGLHFFNPAHRMPLVEIVVGDRTDPDATARAEALCRGAGKETVRVRDRPGFATSRLSALLGNEAMRMLEEGVATAEDIDKAARLGLGHPMGPLELGDLVGLDVRLAVLRHLHETLGDRFRPAPLLERYVAEGRLGRKAHRGVYDYEDE